MGWGEKRREGGRVQYVKFKGDWPHGVSGASVLSSSSTPSQPVFINECSSHRKPEEPEEGT